MRTNERRQIAERPTLLPDRRWVEISSSGAWPTLATAIPSDCIGSNRKPLSGRADAMTDGRLVFTASNVTEARESVSDELLLRHVAEGDRAAMHVMFARHRARVFRFIQRIVCNPAIADDLVSQVFLDVWRSATRFEGRARVSTWLLSIARFKAINSRRERAHEDIDQGDSLEIADAADTPDVALDRKDTQGILRTCIDRLSPAHREIIDLFYYRENSVAEVSEMIGIPQATVKSRIFYARKQLARILVGAGSRPQRPQQAKDGRAARLSREQHPNMQATSSQRRVHITRLLSRRRPHHEDACFVSPSSHLLLGISSRRHIFRRIQRLLGSGVRNPVGDVRSNLQLYGQHFE